MENHFLAPKDQLQPSMLIKFLESTLYGIIVSDANARIVYTNPAFTALTGYTQEEALGRSPRFLHSGKHDSAFYERIWQSLRESGQWQGELWNRRSNGEEFAVWENISAVSASDTGEVTHYTSVFCEITDRKREEAKLLEINTRLNEMVMTDELTEVANRRYFNQALSVEWGRARRYGSTFSLLVVDVDRFKSYNDRYGHAKGDVCLRDVAIAIRSVLRRAGDLVARYGGEEFAIILPATERRGAEAVAAKIHHRLTELAIPHEGSEPWGRITVSIGGSSRDSEGEGGHSEMFEKADQSLYAAKRSGRNCTVFLSEWSDLPNGT